MSMSRIAIMNAHRLAENSATYTRNN